MTPTKSKSKISNIRDIRKSWLLHGDNPIDGLEMMLGNTVYKSWQRCLQSGLDAYSKALPDNILSGQVLQSRIEQREDLIALAKPTMNYLHGLMSGSGGVIVLSDHQGVIVHSVGDPEFINKADRVLLKTGASWMEKHRGTNAIGTALVEGAPVSINGSEHFLENNGFLSCAAAPIFQPDGKISSVLNVSTDKDAYHPHTISLVKATAHALEKQLFFASESAYKLIIKLHTTPEGIGSIGEGLIGINESGVILGIDRAALSYLGITAVDIGEIKIHQILDSTLDSFFDNAKKLKNQTIEVKTYTGRNLYLSSYLSEKYYFSNQTTKASADSTETLLVMPTQTQISSFEPAALSQVSRLAIERTLEKTSGNVSLAAKLLGISRNTLYRYLKK